VPNTSLKKDQDKTCKCLCWFKLIGFVLFFSAEIAKLKVLHSVLVYPFQESETLAFERNRQQKLFSDQGRFPLSDVMTPPTLTSPSASQRSFHTSILTPPLFHPVVSDIGLCDLYVRVLTYTRFRGDRISPHFLSETRKALKRRLLRIVAHGSDHIGNIPERNQFAFTLSSMMAAQDFNFLLATDSYKVRIS